MLIFGSDLLKIPKCDFLAFLPNFGHLDSEKRVAKMFFLLKRRKISVENLDLKNTTGSKSQFVNLMKESVLMVEEKRISHKLPDI